MTIVQYALTRDSVIANIALADTSTDDGTAWLDATLPTCDRIDDISADSPQPQIGWLWTGTGYVAPATLATDTSTLAADGSNSATVTFTDNTSTVTSVTFTVNGATTTEATVGGVAEIMVKASAVGPITATCEGLSITMEAN